MNKITSLLLILILFIGAASIEDARKANEAYHNGEFEKAIELYKKAIESNPEDEKLYYNLASALAKEGETEEAIRYFEQFKAMTESPEKRAMADYNIGNIHVDNETWQKAVQSYRNALRFKPMDEDAKHNYELAKRKNQQQQQQNNQQNKNQENKQNQNQNQKNNQQQNKDNNSDNNKQNKSNDQNQQQKQNQDKQNQQNRQQQQPSQISKADAEKILKALEQREKDLLKEFKKQKAETSKKENEKDW